MIVPDFFCLNPQYSTTRIVTKEQPRIENDPSSKVQTTLFLPSHPQRKGEGGLRTKGYFKKSFNDNPLVSIITVVFNGAEHIEQTIKSVISQTYPNIEYIIIDGGSIDGTLDIIKKYENNVDYFVSEPDRGIYDAMNKGIDLANGEWLNFMNAGDSFYNEEVLNKIFQYGRNYKNIDIIYSDTFLNGKSPLVCNKDNNVVIHQSMIYRSNLHKEVGLYLVNEKLLISDYIFFMLCKNKNWYKTDIIISNYNTEGLTSKENFILHLNQKIGADLVFNNMDRVYAGLFLLLYPLIKFFKNASKEFISIIFKLFRKFKIKIKDEL
jgi:glycosyltransferase involved in cell wall biosynthesis